MYYCTCKSLWIEKASGGKLGVKYVPKVILVIYIFDCS